MTVEIARVFAAEYDRAVAVLTRVLGDIDLAEDAVQDAFATAARTWPESGLPPSPAGWIITTARNRAIDRFRRESTREERHAQAALLTAPAPIEPEDDVPDDRLRMVFTCCHPSLAPAARVALTLRLLGGLTTPEIARAFLVPEPTMAQRIVRAKGKIRDARIPYRVPPESELPDRLPSVLAVVYLIFTSGHTAPAGPSLVRSDLCTEAVRLGRLLHALMPDEPEVTGLLALMLLTGSRRAARTTPDGALVRLADQDRTLWDAALIAEGQDLVRACLRRNRPGTYQLQAAIQAVHSDSARGTRRPTGRRSSPSTTGCSRSPRPRSSPCTEPRRWSSSTRSTSTATTCCTPCAATCSTGSAATPRPGRRTRPPRRAPATRRSRRSCAAGPRPARTGDHPRSAEIRRSGRMPMTTCGRPRAARRGSAGGHRGREPCRTRQERSLTARSGSSPLDPVRGRGSGAAERTGPTSRFAG